MKPNAVMVLQARAQARALLYQHGQLELEEAVTVLWRAAEESGLLDKYGEEQVTKIIRTAFHGIADL